jgi:hypothetical protein
LRTLPTFTWKPVVRLTARHGVAGQLATVAGLVAPMTPTSESVAGAVAGSRRASPMLAEIAVFVNLMCGIEHARGLQVAV